MPRSRRRQNCFPAPRPNSQASPTAMSPWHIGRARGAWPEFGGEPNSHVSLVDAAMPGMLPVINEECVRQAVRTGLGLNAQINRRSVFDRKNYFYPDLPQGYQISQYKSPIVGEGEVAVT